jgi:hypothetical protein
MDSVPMTYEQKQFAAIEANTEMLSKVYNILQYCLAELKTIAKNTKPKGGK